MEIAVFIVTLSLLILLRHVMHTYKIKKYLQENESKSKNFTHSKITFMEGILILIDVILLVIAVFIEPKIVVIILPLLTLIILKLLNRRKLIQVFDDVIMIENRLIYWYEIDDVDEQRDSILILKSESFAFGTLKSRNIIDAEELKKICLEKIVANMRCCKHE